MTRRTELESSAVKRSERVDRGRYLTITDAAAAYPIFTPRLLRRLVQERRIAFSRAGRTIVFAESDIEAYLERNRVEPVRSESRF